MGLEPHLHHLIQLGLYSGCHDGPELKMHMQLLCTIAGCRLYIRNHLYIAKARQIDPWITVTMKSNGYRSSTLHANTRSWPNGMLPIIWQTLYADASGTLFNMTQRMIQLEYKATSPLHIFWKNSYHKRTSNEVGTRWSKRLPPQYYTCLLTGFGKALYQNEALIWWSNFAFLYTCILHKYFKLPNKQIILKYCKVT